MKYAQLVIGPAGCGKSTYCKFMMEYCETTKRMCKIMNLDPAADEFVYECEKDIKALISVEDVMEELSLGPNGALLYCMEYLVENIEWLETELHDFHEDELVLFDCPGQLELYTHMDVMKVIIKTMESLEFRICGVCCLDVSFVTEANKLLSGSLSALSTMIQLELPHVNVLTKCDLLYNEQLDENENAEFLQKLLEKEPSQLVAELHKGMPPKFKALNQCFASILEDYSMISFLPLNLNDEGSIQNVMYVIDSNIQYGEDMEPAANFDMGS